MSSCWRSVETRTQIAAFVLNELDISPIHMQNTQAHRPANTGDSARTYQRDARPGPRADVRRKRRGAYTGRSLLLTDRLHPRRGAALTGPARQLLLCGVASLEGCDERLACVLDCLGGAIGGELRLDRCDLGG